MKFVTGISFFQISVLGLLSRRRNALSIHVNDVGHDQK
jgi:hypothetical protein